MPLAEGHRGVLRISDRHGVIVVTGQDDHIGVARRTDRVSPGPADQRDLAIEALAGGIGEGVGAIAAIGQAADGTFVLQLPIETVVARAAEQLVRAGSAAQGVIARAALEQVVPGLAANIVSAVSTPQMIVAGAAIDVVLAACARDDIGAASAIELRHLRPPRNTTQGCGNNRSLSSPLGKHGGRFTPRR